MIVGLTGGIGSGKTTVARFFVELGVPVYNSDEEAKRLMKSSKKLKKEIILLLGENAYDGKSLNKTYISEKIFNDAGLLKKMNSIVHPAVRKHFMKWVKKQRSPYVIQETALLFENSNQAFYDKIILVTASKEQRIQRVMERDGASEKQVLERIANQLEESEKVSLSDFVLENIDLQKTREEVERVHRALLNNS